MIPLLVELGLALAGGVKQKIDAEEEHKKALAQYAKESAASIMNKRASRAGDSMYMQQALEMQKHKPEAPPDPMPGVVAGMGGALLGYNGSSGGFDSDFGGSEDEDIASRLGSAVGKGGWSNPAVKNDRSGYNSVRNNEDWEDPENGGFW